MQCPQRMDCRAFNFAEGLVPTRCVGGFTIIEVLVAILVLTIGILGAAAAQVASLRARHTTGLMSGGVQLASALADRMRANAGQMRAPDELNPYLQLRYSAADGPPAPAQRSCFSGAGCSGPQIADFDLQEIKQAVHAGFPEARMTVCRDAVVWAGRDLRWECSNGGGAPLVIKLGWPRRLADGEWTSTPTIALVVAGTFQ